MAKSEEDLTLGRSEVAHRNRRTNLAANGPSYLPSGAGFFVDSLKGRYKGQKPIALVTRKITANRPSTIAAIPEI